MADSPMVPGIYSIEFGSEMGKIVKIFRVFKINDVFHWMYLHGDHAHLGSQPNGGSIEDSSKDTITKLSDDPFG